MNFLEEYRTAMEQLHASNETLKEVRRMNRNTTSKTRGILRPAYVIAAVLILCTAALATTYRLWSPGLASHFGADEQTQEALMEAGMTALTDNPSVTLENGLTLTLEQVFCDGTETGVVVRYDAPEEGWFTQENRRYANRYTLPFLTVGDTEFFLNSGGIDPVATVTGNTAYGIWQFQVDAFELNGQTATLRLQKPTNWDEVLDFIDSQEERETVLNDPLILPEEVSLSWTLDMGNAISKTLEGSFSGEYQGETLTVADVTITPISIHFTFTEGLDLLEPRLRSDALYNIGLVLTDGTRISYYVGGSVNVPEGTETEPGTEEMYYTFDSAVLDFDSIAGIAFGSWANTPEPYEEAEVVFVLPLQ